MYGAQSLLHNVNAFGIRNQRWDRVFALLGGRRHQVVHGEPARTLFKIWRSETYRLPNLIEMAHNRLPHGKKRSSAHAVLRERYIHGINACPPESGEPEAMKFIEKRCVKFRPFAIGLRKTNIYVSAQCPVRRPLNDGDELGCTDTFRFALTVLSLEVNPFLERLKNSPKRQKTLFFKVREPLTVARRELSVPLIFSLANHKAPISERR